MRSLWLVLALASGVAEAQTLAHNIVGDLADAEINQRLEPLDVWFKRADARCPAKGDDCAVELSVSVAAGGGHPECSIATSAINDPTISGLYCPVVKTMTFPVKPHPTTFVLRFPVPAVTANVAAAGISTVDDKAVSGVAPCPSLDHARTLDDVHNCFQHFQGLIDDLYHKAARTNPSLQGSFVIQLTIDKDGKVTAINDDFVEGGLTPEFVKSELDLVKQFKFGFGQQAMDANYSVHFFGL